MRRVNVIVSVSATLLVNDADTRCDQAYLIEQIIAKALRENTNYRRTDEGVISYFVSAKVD